MTSRAREDPLYGFKQPGAFRHLGLRTNPYQNLDAAGLVEAVSPRPWIRRLAEQRWQWLALTAPSGHGKTTAALMIAAIVAASDDIVTRYLRLPERGARWPTLPGEPALVIIDSVQRMPSWRRRGVRRLHREGRRVILAGHVDVTSALSPRRHGRVLRSSPPPPDVAEIRAVHQQLVGRATLSGQRVPALRAETAAQILHLADGNRYRIHRIQYLAFELLARRATAPAALDEALVREAAELERAEDCDQSPNER